MSRLLQGTPSPVFADVDALMANYAAVQRRLFAAPRAGVSVIPARRVDPVTPPPPVKADAIDPPPAPDAPIDVPPAPLPAFVLDADGRTIHRRDGLGDHPSDMMDGDRAGASRRIIGTVAAMHGLAIEDLLNANRVPFVVRARQDAVVAVRLNRPNLTTSQIGLLFRRDHTTILHALRSRGVPSVITPGAR